MILVRGDVQPTGHRLPERLKIKIVVLVSALSSGTQQPCRFQYLQVLRHGLPAEVDLMPHGQPAAQLEQRLTIPITQLVDDQSTYRCGQGMEHVIHHPEQ